MNNPPASAGRGRGGKRQQQSLYSPGSGPLRKSENSGSNRSLNSIGEGPPAGRDRDWERDRDRDWDRERDRSDWGQNDGWRSVNKKSNNKKHDYYERRNEPPGYRQGSEPRVLSSNPPNVNYNHRPQDRMRNERDTRSVDPGFGGGRGNPKKPPLPLNFDSLPPRLQRKILQDNGLPPDYMENLRNEQASSHPSQSWSHTLPISPRSRPGMRGGSGGGRNRYSVNYQPNYQQEYRARTPVDYQRPRSRSSDVGGEEEFERPPRTNSRNSSCDPNDRWANYGPPARDRDRERERAYDEPAGGFRKEGGRNRQYSDGGSRLEEEDTRKQPTKIDWADDVEREALQEKTASSINSTNNNNGNNNWQKE